jgi:hypothetical protein
MLDGQGDMAPHSAVFLITGEIHERMSGIGKLHANSKVTPYRKIVEIRGADLSLTKDAANRFFENIVAAMKENHIDIEITDGSVSPLSADMLRMRGAPPRANRRNG